MTRAQRFCDVTSQNQKKTLKHETFLLSISKYKIDKYVTSHQEGLTNCDHLLGRRWERALQ